MKSDRHGRSCVVRDGETLISAELKTTVSRSEKSVLSHQDEYHDKLLSETLAKTQFYDVSKVQSVSSLVSKVRTCSVTGASVGSSTRVGYFEKYLIPADRDTAGPGGSAPGCSFPLYVMLFDTKGFRF